ncbi:acetoin dehydrogenase dihydrolipoyllysine-residue acetyltransferase subunit [Cypionkella sp.]|uniref:acetoin dehydrogenase dihydrolipoyllysine-residue acetyltransferase subunit n=1 Tax=Cypionkella sp. TaxID=2811411 RepID=UPI002604FAFD|nr:acetoin dehydrogenase dihydrolipoyllysine-residue acetyltransferase subunit [Cypionkella sp.]MDB5663878.1 acetoin dehydrogenase dihydrolipoyllysine-residue acetyltransferase subunit [Cypionkella sp.]
MPTPVIYPKVSLENAVGKVSQWRVTEGEVVCAGQVLFEIENDKAAVEVEAAADGVIRHLTPAGTEVDVGAQVATIYAPSEAFGDLDTKPQPVATAAAATATTATVTTSVAPLENAQRGPRPTPLARRIARDQSLSIDGLAGTGPRGRVQKKDVLAYLSSLARGPQGTSPAPQRNANDTLHHVWLRRGSGVPVVLLHGFAGDLNNWRGLFAGARFEGPVLALDLPGHGQSPLDIPADMDALALLVEQSIAGLVDGAILLAGHSFGAAVATRIAARGSLDLCGLCLFAPAGLGPEINAAFTEGILRADASDSVRPWLNELVHDSAVISDAFLRAVVEQRRNQPLTDAMRAFANRFFPDGTQSHSILPDLNSITLPTRVVFGRNDRILPFARAAELPGHVALHALATCGHMPHLEQPALARRILSEMRRSA